MYRVQMNTLELMVAFLPSLFLASKYWASPMIAGLGALYLIGRHIYWRSYVSNPSKRGFGFMMSLLPIFILVALSISGIAISLIGLKA